MKKSIIAILFIVLSFCFITQSSALMQPKWGNSDTLPETIVISNGFYQCLYNIQEVEKTDEYGTRTVYDYDYIELKAVTEQSILDALIENEYGGDDAAEIAITILDYYTQNF